MADELARLREENAALRKALEVVAEHRGRCLLGNPDAGDDYGQGYRSGSNAAFEELGGIAAAALAERKDRT